MWARLNEARAVVVSHVGDVGSHGLERFEGEYDTRVFLGQAPPLEIVMGYHRPIANYFASLVCDLVFERFPDVRVASVENGAECLPLLTAGLKRVGRQRPDHFASDPYQQFREHCWIAPFWEDDIDQAIEHIGADRILFGSDWPHVEGLKYPRDYDRTVGHLPEDQRRRIMFANYAELTGVDVVSPVRS